MSKSFLWSFCSTSINAPADKKVKTTNVAVDQPGQPDKILLDTVTEDVEVGMNWCTL